MRPEEIEVDCTYKLSDGAVCERWERVRGFVGKVKNYLGYETRQITQEYSVSGYFATVISKRSSGISKNCGHDESWYFDVRLVGDMEDSNCCACALYPITDPDHTETTTEEEAHV